MQKGLRASAAGNLLLHDVTLSVAAGERVALVGANGAGKSTLLRAFSGFCEVSGGSLSVHSMQLDGRQRGSGAALRHLRSRIEQMHQGLYLVDRLSVLDNVRVGAATRCALPSTSLRHWPAPERAEAHAARARVGMDWAAERRTDSLSSGERQKVAIARALQQRSPILLADEPPACLDVQAAEAVIQLLAAVAQERGSSVICVLHDLELVPRMAIRAICLRRSRVIADIPMTPDTPRQLMSPMS